jgi:hypothetical protein
LGPPVLPINPLEVGSRTNGFARRPAGLRQVG